MVKEVAETLAYVLIGIIVAIGLAVTLFHAAVRYTYRAYPPTAQEIAEDPTLVKYLP